MKKYGVNELRTRFLDFFEQAGHLKMNSSPLVPHNDNSLLLINSGMAPLKPYFTGQETPPSRRVTTCQKCIRTPDIDNVGKTARHGTFFEMLGNFSFGDYFKHEAIRWAWDFLTGELEIPVGDLYVTVYEDDDEAFGIWRDEIGVEERRIVRMGKEDNFWEIGTGPCGPCSEIYVDRGEQYSCGKPDCYVGCDCDRYMEVWNLVFTQFDKDDEGNYNRLSKPNIDTGMGLERLAVYSQGVDNMFEIDTVRYVLDAVCELAGKSYPTNTSQDVSVRVVTDHIRSTVFMLSDGVIPSNEGRGYVLRRLLRRAVRHGKLLGISGNFLTTLAQKVIQTSSGAYPNLIEKTDTIMKILEIEEKKFNETIQQGMSLLSDIFEKMAREGTQSLSGEEAFKLYDTYGFPLELTQELATEKGYEVDTDAYALTMKAQKDRARDARASLSIEGWKDRLAEITAPLPATQFLGYDTWTTDSKVLCIVAGDEPVESVNEGEDAVVVFDRTPFYAQSGGQVGDTGSIESLTVAARVTDTTKSGDKYAHAITIESGSLSVGDTVSLRIDSIRRLDIQRNHTSTHLLHKALKMVLGNHVNQAGSEVSQDRLRFDFNHYEKLSAEEIARVEEIVNEQILACLDVSIEEMDKEAAEQSGAMALFDEKYGARVRVVTAGDFSKELCGGCHLKNTGYAGAFKILSEGGIAAGVRRIEAVTGSGAVTLLRNLSGEVEAIASQLKTTPQAATQRAGDVMNTISTLTKENTALKAKLNASFADDLLAGTFEANGVKVLIAESPNLSMDELREMCDKLRDKMGGGVVFLTSPSSSGVSVICGASKDIAPSRFDCGKFVKAVASSVGSGGGGRPDMAQAGVKDASKSDELLKNAREMLAGFVI